MNTVLPGSKIDLSNCDREPIHILGAIQNFGFLIAVKADWTVARVSKNLEALTGVAASALLGKPLETVFAPDALHGIRNRVAFLRGTDAIERIFGLDIIAGQARFDLAIHFSGSFLIIEAEPHKGAMLDAANQVRALLSGLSEADSMAAFYGESARQVRALTGFDRVMVYRFDHAGSGEVVAEALQPGIDSFLGLNYPASDIPAQARALYLRNLFRIISDVRAEPVPLMSSPDTADQVLDQSMSVLRSVSPIHIEYLKNMGVEASLSASIVVEGRLWGLFACHHSQPRLPSFAERSAAELYGQMFSLMRVRHHSRRWDRRDGRRRRVVGRQGTESRPV